MGILKNFDGDGHEAEHFTHIANIDPLVHVNNLR